MARVDTSKMKCNQVRSSTKAGKKRMVLACAGGKKRLIHFGDSRMQDFTQHKDQKRRSSYLARARGIKNKKGELTYKDKNTANYWSIKYLWNG